MRSVVMDSSEDNSDNFMLLRSGFAKWSADISSSRNISDVCHFDQYTRTYEPRQFSPDLTSTPLHFTSDAVVQSSDRCAATFGGILNTSRSSHSSGSSKKVHFEGHSSSFCKGSGNGVSTDYLDAEAHRREQVFGSSAVERSLPQRSGGSWYANERWCTQGKAEINGTTRNGSLASKTFTKWSEMRTSRDHHDVFSSDEEDVASDATGHSSESIRGVQPVYIIKDAASYAARSRRATAELNLRPVVPASRSARSLVSKAFLFVWGTLYKCVCSVMIFDAWLLSRLSAKRRRQLGALVLLLLLPVVLWPSISSSRDSSTPVVSAATSFHVSMGEAWSTAWSFLFGVLPHPRPSSSSPSDSLEEEPSAAEEVRLPRGQLEHVDLKAVVRALVTEHLQKLQPGTDSLSRDQVEKMNVQVEDRLKSKLSGVEEQSRVVATDVETLRAKVEQLGMINDELRVAGDKLQQCCRSNKDLLETFDAKVFAAVLEVLNQPSMLASQTAFHKWILNELSSRDSRLSVALDELRQQAAVAAARSERAETALQEVRRQAGETTAAVADVRSQVESLASSGQRSGLTVGDINVSLAIREALMLYDADKTGMPDYALESAGGSVVNTRCTETYGRGTAHYRVFGLPIWTMTRTPREAIQPGVKPGECWAFRGSQGNLVLQLAMKIRPTGFTVEHIPKSLAIGRSLDSAPKEFTILGLESDNDYKGKVLGKYVYDIDGDPLQYFAVEEPDVESFRYIEMQITSNHGNLEYTCLYRIRVHGVPAS